MAKKITINSNVKLVTSGTAPTLENLKKGEMAFGQENGSLKLWGNPDGKNVMQLPSDSPGVMMITVNLDSTPEFPVDIGMTFDELYDKVSRAGTAFLMDTAYNLFSAIPSPPEEESKMVNIICLTINKPEGLKYASKANSFVLSDNGDGRTSFLPWQHGFEFPVLEGGHIPIKSITPDITAFIIHNLADGEASGAVLSPRALALNLWEYYWREVWEENEESGLYHANQTGVDGVMSELKSVGVTLSPPETVTDVASLIGWMKTQELHVVGYDVSRAKGYAGAVFGVNNNSEAPSTYVEGGLNTVGKNFFRFHVEGMRHNLSESDYQVAGHVEGQLHQMKGYGTVNHIEGNGNMYAGLNPSAKEGGSYRQGDAPVAVHVEGGMNLAAGEYSHIEGVGNIGLGKRDHIEGFGNTSKASEVYAAYPDYGATLWQSMEDDWRSITPTHSVYRFQASVGTNTGNHVEGGFNFVYGLTWGNASVALEHGVPAELSSCYYYAHIHAEGVLNYAKGTVLHVEGIFNEATGIASHVEGFYNKVQNAGEHASGYWNASHKASETKGDAGNTLYSIGCGTSEDDRKNALEVMQDGTIYMLDTSSGAAMNVQNLLKSAEKAITLKPGQGLKIGADGDIEIDVDSLKQLLGLA